MKTFNLGTGSAAKVIPEIFNRGSPTKAFGDDTVPARTGTGWIAYYIELLKPRPLFMVVLSAMAGFYLGISGKLPFGLFLSVFLGTFWVGGGAMALNQ